MIGWMSSEVWCGFRGQQKRRVVGAGRLSQYAARIPYGVKIFMMQAHVFQSTGPFSLISSVVLRAQAALAQE